LHEAKHSEQRISTHFGIQIDESDEQFLNASDPIRRSLDDDSNLTSRRDLHDDRQFEQRISTQFGIQIHNSDAQFEKAKGQNERAVPIIIKPYIFS
jgi:hypothetical protein